MEIQEVHNRIRERMTYLSTTVRGASAMGQTDIHRLCETVICPVLKTILQLPALRNLNATERDNFPGIDLGDPVVGVGIQVTASADAAKIRGTIKTCIRNGVHHTYPHLRFFVLTAKQSAYRLDTEDDLAGKLLFNPKVDVLDYTDILAAASKLEMADLLAVDEALQASLGIRSAVSQPSTATAADDPGWLNLLPISFPARLYLGETIPEARPKGRPGQRDPRGWAKKYLNDQGLRFSTDWAVYDGQIVTFHDLHQRQLPLSHLVDPGTVTDLAAKQYYDIDANYRRAFKTLLRLCMQQLLYQRNVFWQHQAGIFCFGPAEEGASRRYESWADKKPATREVYKRVPKRDKPDDIYYCKHLAFRTAFHVLDSTWYLSIKPEWFFSSDGYRPWFWGSERIEYLKRIEKNQAVFNHVKFLSAFLRRPPDLFGEVPLYRFLTFKALASLPGLLGLDDDAWRSDEPEATRGKLGHLDGALPLELGDV